MDQKQLYQLRKESLRDFKTTKELRMFLEDVLGEQRILPMVVGHLQFDPKGNWRVVGLKPLRPTDKLTVELYLQGLREIEKIETHNINSAGAVLYEGVELMNQDYYTRILRASICDVKNPCKTFNLSFNFDETHEQGMGYSAYSNITQTEIEKNFARFIGPNTRYEEYPK